MKSRANSNSKVLTVCLIILLCISFALCTTNAWFTAGASADGTGGSDEIRLGTIGDINIVTNSFVWQNSSGNNVYTSAEAKANANDTNGEVRTVIFPGDKLQTGSVTLTYDSAKSSSQDQVFYLIKLGSTYYTINASGALVAQTTSADTILAGTANKKTLNGSIVSITTSNGTYNLDGSTSSSSIDNSAQGKLLTELSAKAGIISLTSSGVKYNVAIIQSANMTATKAFTELKTILDKM